MPKETEFGKSYFEWSRQDPPPEIWRLAEKPAMRLGIDEAFIGSTLQMEHVRVFDIGVGGGKTIDFLLEY